MEGDSSTAGRDVTRRGRNWLGSLSANAKGGAGNAGDAASRCAGDWGREGKRGKYLKWVRSRLSLGGMSMQSSWIFSGRQPRLLDISGRQGSSKPPSTCSVAR